MPASGERSTTGLDPHLVGALAYLLGFVSGILLLVLEKDSPFVRFHAIQSTLFFLGVLLANVVLVALPLTWLFAPLFVLSVVGVWLFLMFKAVTGYRYHLPYVGDIAADYSR